MNSTIAKLADEFEKMEKTIASQKKMIETLMPTGYVDTDTMFPMRSVPRRTTGTARTWFLTTSRQSSSPTMP